MRSDRDDSTVAFDRLIFPKPFEEGVAWSWLTRETEPILILPKYLTPIVQKSTALLPYLTQLVYTGGNTSWTGPFVLAISYDCDVGVYYDLRHLQAQSVAPCLFKAA